MGQSSSDSMNHCHSAKGRDGLVVRSRLRDRKVPGSKPESAVCMGMLQVKSYIRAQESSDSVVQKFGEGCRLRCFPRHLRALQTCDGRTKIAHELLRKHDVNK
ncbi:hypothetical protein AVEN_124393-1 [Araneus ventricosus]|uniref:Uncharacterized protein n=1 Tax=Araneus ventricosus TaxID=182803 RepID=A0A4Y2SCU6_ARAVE|nr:hypothetical protein AVEN_251886-1 [Araneus ventricosus]GBN85643.1 hypothetical protein AVEN_124393-1 [Araneus ventricosus]